MDCYFAGRGGFSCLWPIDKHHILKQQTIRSRFPFGAWYDGTPRTRDQVIQGRDGPFIPTPNIVEDERNIIPACRAHHENWHHARFTVARSDLPQAVEEFAREYGMEWALDRAYGRRQEAA